MELTIGTYQSPDTEGVIEIRGRRQIMLEWGPHHELQVTMDLYGVGGVHIARLRRNQWTFNDRSRFDFQTEGKTFRVLDAQGTGVVLAGRVAGRDAIHITEGAFHASDGARIEILEEAMASEAASPVDAVDPRLTIPPFAEDEVAVIRRAVGASTSVIACPRCDRSLTTQNMATFESVMVSCSACKTNVVIRRSPGR